MYINIHEKQAENRTEERKKAQKIKVRFLTFLWVLFAEDNNVTRCIMYISNMQYLSLTSTSTINTSEIINLIILQHFFYHIFILVLVLCCAVFYFFYFFYFLFYYFVQWTQTKIIFTIGWAFGTVWGNKFSIIGQWGKMKIIKK